MKNTYTNKDMFKEWLDGLNCSQEEKNNRLSYMERFITFKDKKIENITKANLTCFRNEFQKNEYLYPTTKNRILGHVKAVYNYAYEVYDIKNISTVIKPYLNDKQEKEVITLEEFNKMIEFEKNPIIYAFFYTANCILFRFENLRLQIRSRYVKITMVKIHLYTSLLKHALVRVFDFIYHINNKQKSVSSYILNLIKEDIKKQGE